MRIPVAWAAVLGCLLTAPASAQPATWVDESFDFVQILPEMPNSRTPIVFQLATACNALWFSRVERTGFSVMVEITMSDYCDNHVPPVTETAELGVVPAGEYSIEFYSCSDQTLPGEEPCYRAGAGGFIVSEAPVRSIPFASLETLLALPLLLLFVALRMLR